MLNGTIIVDDARLTGHRIVNRKDAWTTGDCLNNRLKTLLKLLTEHVDRRGNGRLSLEVAIHHLAVQTEATELLGCSLNVEQLLLKSSLLLSQVVVGCYQLIIEVLIHAIGTITEIKSWRSKNLVRRGDIVMVIVVVAVDRVVWEESSLCSLWSSLVVSLRRESAALEAPKTIVLRSNGSRFRSRTQPC